MDNNLLMKPQNTDEKQADFANKYIHLLTSLRSVSSPLIGLTPTSMSRGLIVDGSLGFDARETRKIHLADRRQAVTVCGAIVGAHQIGTYAESLLILGDKTIVRREVFSGFDRVRRAYRCKCCFRRVERIL